MSDYREMLVDGLPLPSPYSVIAADMNKKRYKRMLAPGAHCATCTCKTVERIALAASNPDSRKLSEALHVTRRTAQRYIKAMREGRSEVTFSKWR